VITGYGAASYSSVLADRYENNFTASFSPVFLYRIGEDVLMEGELELALHDDQTKLSLEHLMLHYQAFERVQLRIGRFHLPFSLWSHTDWVNKMPSAPLLYEDTHGEAAGTALMPIPFDVGAAVDWTLPVLEDGWRTSAVFWVSQGPKPGEIDEHDLSAPVPKRVEDSPVPTLVFGSNYSDNNSNKMVGLRLRTMSEGGLTLQAAGFHTAYDAAGDLGFSGVNLSAKWAPLSGVTPRFDLRGEVVVLHQQYSVEGNTESVSYGGYYVQLSKLYDKVEPVLRWSQLPAASTTEGPLMQKRRQLALGVDYWMFPQAPIQAAYQVELDGTDSFSLEWIVGF